MPALNFSIRFGGMVEAGVKRQTIRRVRSRRPIRPGDTLYLYVGQRTRACRKLGEAVCTAVRSISIGELVIWVVGVGLDTKEEAALACADGFSGARELREWFAARYGLPFEGVVITW